MPIIEQQTGEKDGQPIIKPVYFCDTCGSYGHAIKQSPNGKTTIGCKWVDDEPGCSKVESSRRKTNR